jgi:hypothetical protein
METIKKSLKTEKTFWRAFLIAVAFAAVFFAFCVFSGALRCQTIEAPSDNTGRIKFIDLGCVNCHTFMDSTRKINIAGTKLKSPIALQNWLTSGKMSQIYKFSGDSLDVVILSSYIKHEVKKLKIKK